MRKSFFITAFLIAAALGSLLLLAFNQFQLYGRHEQIIIQTEKLIFHYSSIREQIIENIVQGKQHELALIVPAVEELHNNIIRILDNSLIPAEYKFSFMQQIDLPGLILLLRRTGAESNDNGLLRRVNEETRIIGERFMLLERLILGYAKQKLVDFQMIIIGTLALVVFLVTSLMFITYRLLIVPVVNLAVQSDRVLHDHQARIDRMSGWEQVADLAGKMNQLLEERQAGQESAIRFTWLLHCCRTIARKVLETGSTQELYQAVCRSLLSNPDYILVWIGIEDDAENRSLAPVAADGSSTMTGEECQECFGALLAAQEGEEDPSRLALTSARIITRNDILAESPKGPFKNTPLASGKVDSISVPIVVNRETSGVLTVYAMSQDGFAEQEREMLSGVADMVAARLNMFAIRRKNELEQRVKNLLGEKNDIVVFVLNSDGRVASCDSFLNGSAFGKIAAGWLHRHISEIVMPEKDPEKIMFKSSLAQAKRYDFNARLPGFHGIFSAIMAPLDFPADEALLLLVLIPPNKNLLIQPENFQLAYSAAIGQYATTIAHEITDLSNGIINYAQMITDGAAGEPAGERKKYLQKIIEGGEKAAKVVEPLLIDQQQIEYVNEREKIEDIFAEVFRLTGNLLRKDGIKVSLQVEPPTLQCRKQHLQLILLTLLSRAREILNNRSHGKDTKKVLDFSAGQFMEDAKSMIRLEVLLTGSKADPEGEEEPDHPAGLWLSQELARNLGGEMKYSSAGPDRIKIELILPA